MVCTKRIFVAVFLLIGIIRAQSPIPSGKFEGYISIIPESFALYNSTNSATACINKCLPLNLIANILFRRNSAIITVSRGASGPYCRMPDFSVSLTQITARPNTVNEYSAIMFFGQQQKGTQCCLVLKKLSIGGYAMSLATGSKCASPKDGPKCVNSTIPGALPSVIVEGKFTQDVLPTGNFIGSISFKPFQLVGPPGRLCLNCPVLTYPVDYAWGNASTNIFSINFHGSSENSTCLLKSFSFVVSDVQSFGPALPGFYRGILRLEHGGVAPPTPVCFGFDPTRVPAFGLLIDSKQSCPDLTEIPYCNSDPVKPANLPPSYWNGTAQSVTSTTTAATTTKPTTASRSVFYQ